MDNADHLRNLASACRGQSPGVAGPAADVIDLMADFCDCLARMIERVEGAAVPPDPSALQ